MLQFVLVVGLSSSVLLAVLVWWQSRSSQLARRADEILDVLTRGQPATATVRSLETTGRVTGTRSFEIYEFILELEVAAGDAPSRIVKTSQLIDGHRSAVVQPGCVVQLRVDARDPSSVAVSASPTADTASPLFNVDRVRFSHNMTRTLTVFIVFGLAFSALMAFVE